jgi:Ti-type conjugative transfer relaxase TraA|tara:strand:+ start:12802 stop:19764 length:6963 start_codon:yes stop_codon:yes gene_type:complete
MAIQYIRERYITRSNGHNALAAAAYRANETLYCERTGTTYNYSNKGDCVYSQILLPEAAYDEKTNDSNHPFLDRETLWNAVEEAESSHNRRATAQLSFELKVALPKELTREQNIELINQYVKDHYVDRYGVAADICIHDKGDGNPHAHVMFTLRNVLKVGFSKTKNREVTTTVRKVGRNFVPAKRGRNIEWDNVQNRFFQAKEIDLKVDEAGIVPTVHEGTVRDSEHYYGRAKHNESVREDNLDIAMSSPSKIIKELEKRHAVFDERDIKSLTFTMTGHSDNPHDYDDSLKAVLSSSSLVSLGYNDAGRASYTTVASYKKEVNMSDHSNDLSVRNSLTVSLEKTYAIAAKNGLSDEQTDGLIHLIQSGDISCLVGVAGAGKTTLLASLHEVYQEAGISVKGASVSGKAVEGLEEETGIKSRTVHGMLYTYREGGHALKFLPEEGSVLVIDEAGMIGLHDMADLVKMSHERKYVLKLIGDPEQLQPIDVGAPFRAILQNVGFYKLEQVRRQSCKKECAMTHALSRGDTGLAIDHYVSDDRLLLDNSSNLKTELFKQWESYTDDLNSSLIIAHTNEDVFELNYHARNYLSNMGRLGEGHEFTVKVSDNKQVKEFAANDRIVFLKNDRKVGVKNGSLGQIQSIEEGIVSVLLDNGKTVSFNPRKYNEFDHGYAVTVHKSQGATVDNCLTYVSGKGWDKYLSYVAMSRHRHNLHVYADQSSYNDLDGLKRQLSSTPLRDNILDFPLQQAIRLGQDAHKMAGRAVSHVKGNYKKAKKPWDFLFNYSAAKVTTQSDVQHDSLTAKQALNKEAMVVASLKDLHDDVIAKYAVFREQYGNKWYESPEGKAAYGPVEDAFYSRNKAAYDVHLTGRDFDRALQLNNLTQVNVDEWQQAYLAEQRVRSFSNAGNSFVKGRIAGEILEHSESNRYVSSKNLWSDVNALDLSYRARIEAKQAKGFTELQKTVQEYLDHNKAAAKYWNKSEAEHQNDGGKMGDEFVLPAHQAKYKAISESFSKRSEALASEIMGENKESYSRVLEVMFTHKPIFEKVRKTLANKANRHDGRKLVNEYLNTPYTSQRKSETAYLIQENFKAYAGSIYNSEIDLKQLNKDALPHKCKVVYESLSPEDKTFYNETKPYVATIRSVEERAGRVSDLEALRNEFLTWQSEYKLATKALDKPAKLAYIMANPRPEKVIEVSVNQAKEKMYIALADRNEAAFDLNSSQSRLESMAKVDVRAYERQAFLSWQRKFIKSGKDLDGDAKKEAQLAFIAKNPRPEKVTAEMLATYSSQKDAVAFNDVIPTMRGKGFLNQVALHKERLEAKDRVEAYLTGGEQDHKLAFEMTERYAKHAFYIKKHRINTKNLWNKARTHKRELLFMSLPYEDKVILSELNDYRNLCQQVTKCSDKVKDAEDERKIYKQWEKGYKSFALKLNDPKDKASRYEYLESHPRPLKVTNAGINGIKQSMYEAMALRHKTAFDLNEQDFNIGRLADVTATITNRRIYQKWEREYKAHLKGLNIDDKSSRVAYLDKHPRPEKITQAHCDSVTKDYGNDDLIEAANFHGKGFLKHVELHEEMLEAKIRVAEYIDGGAKDKQTAHRMVERYGKHAFFLKLKEADIGLVFAQANEVRYNLDNAKLEGVDKQVHRAMADYKLSVSESSQAWKQAFKTKGSEDFKAAKECVSTQNELAYKASRLVNANPDSKALDLFKDTNAKRHQANQIKFAEHITAHQMALDIKEYKAEQNFDQIKILAIAIHNNYELEVVEKGLQTEDVSRNKFMIDAGLVPVPELLPQHDLEVTAPDYGMMDEYFVQTANASQKDSFTPSVEQYPKSKYQEKIRTTWDADLISQRLMEDPVSTYTEIFGEPKSKSPREMKWSGGLIVTLTGNKAGCWYDFTQGKGGTPLQALQNERGLNFVDSLQEGARMAHLTEDQAQISSIHISERIKSNELIKAKQLEDQNCVYNRRMESARSIWDSTTKIAFTKAEIYMEHHRNVYDVNHTQLRFLPVGAKWIDFEEIDGEFVKQDKVNKVPAMVIASRDKDGKIMGVQRTYLDPETDNKNKSFDNPKLSKGIIRNGGVLQEGTNGRVYVAEGIETGASIGLADKDSTVLISMSVSNMQNMVEKIKSYDPKEVIILKDNDGDNAMSYVGFDKAVDAYKDAGFNLKVFEPEMSEKIVELKGTSAKTDWNDVIQEKGVNGIRKDLGLPIPEYEKNYLRSLDENIKPRHPGPEDKDNDYRAVYNHLAEKKKQLLTLHDFNCGRITDIEIVKESTQITRKSAFDIVKDEGRSNAAKAIGLYDKIYADAEKYAANYAAKKEEEAQSRQQGRSFKM